MIYPNRRAVTAAVAGAPVALAVAALAPQRWFLAVAWPVAILLLCLVDSLRTRGEATARVSLPIAAFVGEERDAAVSVAIASRPREAQFALSMGPLIDAADAGRTDIALSSGRGAGIVPLTMKRRGIASFDQASLRWTGPLGLMWRQKAVEIGQSFPIVPDLRPLNRNGIRLFERHAFEGLMLQPTRGEGTDFDALVEFRQGMDRRTVDWKHSARHTKLLAKRYHGERNNQIVFAVDSGRQMSEPVAGVPRVDRAVSAMLLTGWVALKLGDRVAVNSFNARPRVASGFVSGGSAFAELQRVAAAIDYSMDETNYTFALTQLGGQLRRRSMIVLFTEFTDPTSADFMVRAIRRLAATHLVIVVVLRDEELEALADREPASADDVTRAITAVALLKERRLVISRLQHAGVQLVEAAHDEVGERLAEAYLQTKRKNLL